MRAATTTLGPKARQTYEPSGPLGRSNLRTLFLPLETQPFYTTCGAAAPLFLFAASAATITLRGEAAVKLKNPPAHGGGQSYEPFSPSEPIL